MRRRRSTGAHHTILEAQTLGNGMSPSGEVQNGRKVALARKIAVILPSTNMG